LQHICRDAARRTDSSATADILFVIGLLVSICNKTSAVAEMGDRLATVKRAEKWGAAMPLSVEGGAGSPSKIMWPGTRPTSVPYGILIHQTVWPQYTNVTDRQTDRQTENGSIA